MRHNRLPGDIMSSYSGYSGRPAFPSGRILLALIIAGISLISYCSTTSRNPITNEKQHIEMTVDQEIALGLQAAPEMAAQFGGPATDDEAGQRLVARVGRRIIDSSSAGSSDYRFHFTLLRDPETINAFALPGGQVFITEGLLKRLTTEGELAGVLGHEIGHVVARHGAEHIAKEKLTQGLTGAAVIATTDPNNPNSRYSAGMAILVGKLVNLRFSRQDELEADSLGVRFMSEAGYDPRSMLQVMRILADASRGGMSPEFFNTHPNPEHRMTRIESAIEKQFPHGVPDGLEP